MEVVCKWIPEGQGKSTGDGGKKQIQRLKVRKSTCGIASSLFHSMQSKGAEEGSKEIRLNTMAGPKLIWVFLFHDKEFGIFPESKR